jgi:hypothetical protein
MFPAVAEQWGAATVGLLYAAPPVGAMAAAMTSRWSTRVRRHGLAIVWAAALWGTAIVGFGLARPLCGRMSGPSDVLTQVHRV